YNTETDSIQEYEPFLNDEHIEYRTETDSNSRLSNVGDKVVETVKHGVCSVLGTTDKSNQEQKTQRPLTANRSNSPSSKIAQKEISEIEEEYLFVVSRSEY
ncbi:5451_t:CDS:2, partial [Rhizophagus irregularis]